MGQRHPKSRIPRLVSALANSWLSHWRVARRPTVQTGSLDILQPRRFTRRALLLDDLECRSQVHPSNTRPAPRLTAALRESGLEQSADRLGYLERLADEDRDEEPIAIASLRHLTSFLMDERHLGQPEIGVSPAWRGTRAMARTGQRNPGYGVSGLGTHKICRHVRPRQPGR